jgi:hypothetical protein
MMIVAFRLCAELWSGSLEKGELALSKSLPKAKHSAKVAFFQLQHPRPAERFRGCG